MTDDANDSEFFLVQLLNDPKTPMEFVVDVLRDVFGKTQAQSVTIMLETHRRGAGICGTFEHAEAAEKVREVEQRARVVGHPLKCVLVSVAEQPNTSLGHVHLIFRLTRKEMISRHAHYVVRRMIPRYLQIFAASFVIPGVFLAISRRGVLYPQVLHMAEFYLGLAVILCAIVLVSHEIRCFRAKDQPFDTTVSMKPDDIAFMFGRANLITLPISRVKFTKVRDGLIVEFGRRLFALIPFRVISSDDRARIAKLYGFRL